MTKRVEVDVWTPRRLTVYFGSRGYFCAECGQGDSLDHTPDAPDAVEKMALEHLKTHYYCDTGYCNYVQGDTSGELDPVVTRG